MPLARARFTALDESYFEGELDAAMDESYFEGELDEAEEQIDAANPLDILAYAASLSQPLPVREPRPFLSLPLIVRNMIFRQLLVRTHRVYLTLPDEGFGFGYMRGSTPLMVFHDLRQTCREIYRHTTSLFLGENVLVVEHWRHLFHIDQRFTEFSRSQIKTMIFRPAIALSNGYQYIRLNPTALGRHLGTLLPKFDNLVHLAILLDWDYQDRVIEEIIDEIITDMPSLKRFEVLRPEWFRQVSHNRAAELHHWDYSISNRVNEEIATRRPRPW